MEETQLLERFGECAGHFEDGIVRSRDEGSGKEVQRRGHGSCALCDRLRARRSEAGGVRDLQVLYFVPSQQKTVVRAHGIGFRFAEAPPPALSLLRRQHHFPSSARKTTLPLEHKY